MHSDKPLCIPLRWNIPLDGNICNKWIKIEKINFKSIKYQPVNCKIKRSNCAITLYWHIYLCNIPKNIVTRNNIVWKLARSYCLCYCKIFSLVPDSTECTKLFLWMSAVHYLYHLISNNVIGQRKTTNTEKHFYPWLTSFNLKLSCS